MATSPALVGAPVSASRSQQLRINLVTKSHHKTFMATESNPAVRCEALVLHSTPRQLLLVRNRVRAATMKAEVPKFTQGIINNKSDVPLTHLSNHIWQGYPLYVAHVVNPNTVPDSFSHKADSGGSVAGLEYRFGNNYALVVAWSNDTQGNNKVYVKIQPTTNMDWDSIKSSLDISGGETSGDQNFGYACSATIVPPTSGTVTMTVDFKQGQSQEFGFEGAKSMYIGIAKFEVECLIKL